MIPIISTLALGIGMQRSKTSAPLPVKVDQFEVYYRQVTFKCNALLRSHNDDLCQLQCLLFALIAIFPSFFLPWATSGLAQLPFSEAYRYYFFFSLAKLPRVILLLCSQVTRPFPTFRASKEKKTFFFLKRNLEGNA